MERAGVLPETAQVRAVCEGGAYLDTKDEADDQWAPLSPRDFRRPIGAVGQSTATQYDCHSEEQSLHAREQSAAISAIQESVAQLASVVSELNVGRFEEIRSVDARGNSNGVRPGNFQRGGLRGRARGNRETSRSSAYNEASARNAGKCHACKSTAHFMRECPRRFCQACGKNGHDAWSDKCPNFGQ